MVTFRGEFFFSYQMIWLLPDRSGFFTPLFTNRNKTAVGCAIRRSTLAGIRSSQTPRSLNSRVNVTYLLKVQHGYDETKPV